VHFKYQPGDVYNCDSATFRFGWFELLDRVNVASEDTMSNEELSALLSSNRERIVGQWAKMTKTSSPLYSERSLEEIRQDLSALFDGVIRYVGLGDRRLLDEHIERISRMRVKSGFELSDTLMVLSLGLRAVYEILRNEGEFPSDPNRCFSVASEMSEVFCEMSMLHARIAEDAGKKASIAEAMSVIAKSHETLDEETIARHSVESLRERFGIRAAVLILGEPGEPSFTGGDDPDEDHSFRYACDEAVKRGEMIKLEPSEAMISSASTARVFIGVPVVVKGRILGAVSVASDARTQITDEEIGVVNSIATQIGVACDNARMYHGAVDMVSKLSAGRSELFAILSTLEAAVYVSDMDTYEIIAVNGPMEEGYGLDLVGKRCYEVLQTGMTGPCPFCTNDRLMAEGVPTGPYTWKFKNTKTGKWYNCVDKAVRWPDGRYVRIELAFDITDMENALVATEQANRQVQLYNDLLLHDMGNYMNTIKGYIDLVLENEGIEKDLKSLIMSASSQTGKCAQLLDKIRKFSKMQSASDEAREIQSLNDLLDETIAELQEVSNGIIPTISKDYGDSAHSVMVGAFAKEIFLNLLTNAVKYGEGKDIEIRIDDDSIDGLPAWKVTIADHGPGIPPDLKDHIFKRYSRLECSKKMKGTGLGLSIAKTLTDRYGGDLRMGDRVLGDCSKGASFSVHLPKA